MKFYQFRVFNESIDFIVTTSNETDGYNQRLAQRTAMDYYGYTEEQVQNVNIEFICHFYFESVINVNAFKSK